LIKLWLWPLAACALLGQAGAAAAPVNGDVPAQVVDPSPRSAAPGSAKQASRPLLSARAMACVSSAAEYHKVNPAVLEAIGRHESRGRPHTVTTNSNGSLDVGLMGINSVHFPELSRAGVKPGDLLDECVAVYVGAWKLSKKLAKHGNTWWAVGAYHSETPHFNVRYQQKILAELIAMGALKATQRGP
jgi:soluble lytic murein transglycosylase-like protein